MCVCVCLSGPLQNLTEFNTAHNKRISLLTIEEGNLEIQRSKRKRRNSRVTFNEEDDVINPGNCSDRRAYIPASELGQRLNSHVSI